MTSKNQFQFAASRHLAGVTVLEASMSDFSYEKHAHEEYSLGVTLQGRQDFFAQRAFHKSSPGKVIIFNPEDVHDGHSGGDANLHYQMLYFRPEEMLCQFRALGVSSSHPLRVKGSVFDDPLLKHQILNLSNLISTEQTSKLEEEASIFQIAQSLVRLNGSLSAPILERRKDKLLLRAKEYIAANLNNDISIDDIANVASMSKFHFIRLFRSQFGITPHQYVLNCRINLAKKALDSGLSSVEVAQLCGFADSSHLNRRFKSYFGMTPKQYQLQLTQ
ncbi:AraC family transcriptional regulator [Vibrio sp. RC27]